MADISIVVASNDTEVVKTIKSVERLEGSTRKLSDSFTKGQISQDQYDRGLREIQQELQKLSLTHQKATALVRKYAAEYNDTQAFNKRIAAERQMSRIMDEAQRENNARLKAEETATNAKIAAQQREAAELDRLRTKYSPLYAASKQYEKALRDIDRALEIRAISDAQHKNSLADLEAQYNSFTAGTAGWENMFVQGANRGQRAVSRFGMYAQQVGYQVGDFFVQIQSGQSAMVAFVQQGTQLAGLLPGMRGAVVGIGLSVAGALYMAFRNVNEEADDFTEQLKEAREYSQGIADNLELVASGFGTEEEFTLAKQIERAEENLQNLLTTYNSLRDTSFSPTNNNGGSETELAYIRVGIAREELEVLQRMQQEEAELEYQRQEGVATGERLLQIRQDVLARQSEAAELYRQETRSLADQQYLAAEALRFRGDEVALSREAFEVNLDNYIRELRLQGVREDQLAILVQQKRAVFELGAELIAANAETAAITAEAERLSQELGISLDLARHIAGTDVGAGISGAVSQAAALAEQLGISLGLARALAGAGVGSGVRSDGTSIYDPRDSRYNAEEAQRQANLVRTAQIMEDIRTNSTTTTPYSPLRPVGGGGSAPSGGGGGGSGGSDDPAETLAGIEKEIKARNELANAVGREGEVLRMIDEIKDQLGDAAENYSDKAIRASAERLVTYVLEQEALKELQEKQENLANSIADQFGTAANSVVDQTKTIEEAFKDMASSIIKQLYDVLVVQRLVGSFDAATGTGTGIAGFIGPLLGNLFANGAAFNSGSVVPFAVGGVVSGPTTFPMSGNRTGLMGEAGPEAIMPLSRGSDGKLGVSVSGTGSVTVVQHFHISANGDESVKKIIKQETPRIAEAAKNAVVNARQRGGSFAKRLG